VGGAYFVLRAQLLHRAVVRGAETKPMTLFHLSNMYLCVLFAAVAVDAAVGLPPFLG
jgi:protoheme IX farnesyltransferase